MKRAAERTDVFDLFAPGGDGVVERADELRFLSGVHAVLRRAHFDDVGMQRRHLEHVLDADVRTCRPHAPTAARDFNI